MHGYKKTAHYSLHFRTSYDLKSRHFFHFDAGSIKIPNLTVNNELSKFQTNTSGSNQLRFLRCPGMGVFLANVDDLVKSPPASLRGAKRRGNLLTIRAVVRLLRFARNDKSALFGLFTRSSMLPHLLPHLTSPEAKSFCIFLSFKVWKYAKRPGLGYVLLALLREKARIPRFPERR